jgi:hypothetical protein
VFDKQIDWFELRDGVYERLSADAAGFVESHVFSGLRLRPEDMVSGDLAALTAGLR